MNRFDKAITDAESAFISIHDMLLFVEEGLKEGETDQQTALYAVVKSVRATALQAWGALDAAFVDEAQAREKEARRDD